MRNKQTFNFLFILFHLISLKSNNRDVKEISYITFFRRKHHWKRVHCWFKIHCRDVSIPVFSHSRRQNLTGAPPSYLKYKDKTFFSQVTDHFADSRYASATRATQSTLWKCHQRRPSQGDSLLTQQVSFVAALLYRITDKIPSWGRTAQITTLIHPHVVITQPRWSTFFTSHCLLTVEQSLIRFTHTKSAWLISWIFFFSYL